jgi:DNA-binding HxlR family transcriptional regulator
MASTASLEVLTVLGQNRWMVPLLAALSRSKGARFVELRNRLDLPRDSLARTIDAAISMGWVMRNPGHGHPLRPELVLSGAGTGVAEAAMNLTDALAAQGLGPTALTRWSLPLIHVLNSGQERFNELARSLPGASPRALSQSLQKLVANDLVGRSVETGYPPTSRYRLTERGLALARAA